MASIKRQNQNPSSSALEDLHYCESSGESVTEYEYEYEDGELSTYTVSIESQKKENQRRIIPADYKGLIGDLDIPNFAAQSPPYHLKKKADYYTLCSGLSAESLKYFQLGNKRQRTVSGAVIRNLSLDFEELARPSPIPEIKMKCLKIPHPAYGFQDNTKNKDQVDNLRISHISNRDSSYGSQLYLRRKSMPQPPPLTRAVPDREQRRASHDDNNSCIIA